MESKMMCWLCIEEGGGKGDEKKSHKSFINETDTAAFDVHDKSALIRWQLK